MAGADFPKNFQCTQRAATNRGCLADSGNRGEQIGYRSVVPESLADMHVQVDIAGTEYETSPELKRILAQLVLPLSGCMGSFPRQ